MVNKSIECEYKELFNFFLSYSGNQNSGNKKRDSFYLHLYGQKLTSF